MGSIQYSSINFSKLDRLYLVRHSESNVFHDETTFYKIFSYNRKFLEIKETKVNLLCEVDNLDNVILPIDKIYNNDLFLGYTSKYISDSSSLETKKLSNEEFNLVMNDVSNTLRGIHNKEIILCDCNFGNIICDKSNKPFFVDMDGAIMPEFVSYNTIPMVTSKFLKSTKKCSYVPSYNNDRLTILLEYLYKIFDDEIINVSEYYYDLKSEEISELKNIKCLIKEIKESGSIPYIPYYDEFGEKTKVKEKN